MKSTRPALAATTLLLLLTLPAEAQVPPFFNGGAGIFDPEIGVVQSGVILDAQTVVSADRKYVTMTTRFQSAQLLNLRAFAFQTGGGAAPAPGVGGAGGVAGGAAAGNVFGRGAEAGAGAANQSAGRSSASSPGSSHAVSRKPYPRPGEASAATAAGASLFDKEGMTLVGRVDAASER